MIAVLYFARAILIPVALALTLNFLLAPAVLYLHRFRLRRVPAVIIVVVFAGAVLGGIGWVVASQLVRIAEQLPDYRVNLHAKLETLHTPTLGPMGRAIRGMREVGQEISAPAEPGADSNRKSWQTLQPEHPGKTTPPTARTTPARPRPLATARAGSGIADPSDRGPARARASRNC